MAGRTRLWDSRRRTRTRSLSAKSFHPETSAAFRGYLAQRDGTRTADAQENRRHHRTPAGASRTRVICASEPLPESTSFSGNVGSSGGVEGGEHSSSSTTSIKTMKSLSASIYNELKPLRLAQRNIIKNRMATKASNIKRAMQAGRVVACGSATTRNKSPLESGLDKITMCASSFAWTYGKRCIRGFQRLQMRPIDFKEQLQMSLHIYLRPSEAAAVASYFDVDGADSVNGELFVRWFLHTGNNSRQVFDDLQIKGHCRCRVTRLRASCWGGGSSLAQYLIFL